MDAQQRLLLEVALEVISAANPPGSKAKVGKAWVSFTVIRLVLSAARLCHVPRVTECAPQSFKMRTIQSVTPETKCGQNASGKYSP